MHESNIEQMTIELLAEQGYKHLSPDAWSLERLDLTEVLLQERLAAAIAKLNPQVPAIAQEQALKMVLNLPSQNLEENNEIFHKYLTEGVEVEYLKDGHIIGDKVYLADFININNNDFILCDQYTVHHKNSNRRPGLVLFVNGFTLGFI